jgi:soluble lytic murein transglycosylase
VEAAIDNGYAGFIAGCFDFALIDEAVALIAQYRDAMTTAELREIATRLQKAEVWDESIRLTSYYMSRGDYTPSISELWSDFRIAYPRAFSSLIEKYAQESNISPALFFGLIRTESHFNASAGSRAGAQGLSQLMEATAEEMAGRIARQGGPDYRGKIDLHDPESNLHMGAVYLRYLEDRMESPMAALLAYNGGMGRVRRWRSERPDLPQDLFLETIEFEETRNYGRRLLASACIYGLLYYDIPVSDMIALIYSTGTVEK